MVLSDVRDEENRPPMKDNPCCSDKNDELASLRPNPRPRINGDASAEPTNYMIIYCYISCNSIRMYHVMMIVIIIIYE